MARLGPEEDVKTSVTAGEGSTRVPAPQPDENVKALNLLIHDLRAPLSVAQGYLRLVQQNRLEAEADRAARDHADDGGARPYRSPVRGRRGISWPSRPSTAGPVMRVRVSAICRAGDRGVYGTVFASDVLAEPDVSGTVRSAQLDRLVQSLAVVLCAVRRSTRNEPVRVSVHEEEKEARFLLGCDDDRAALDVRSPGDIRSVARRAWHCPSAGLPRRSRRPGDEFGPSPTDGEPLALRYPRRLRLHDGPSHNRRR